MGPLWWMSSLFPHTVLTERWCRGFFFFFTFINLCYLCVIDSFVLFFLCPYLLFISAAALTSEDGPWPIMTWARVIDKNHKHLIFHGPNVLHDKLSQHIKEQPTFQSTQTLTDARSEWVPEPLRWKNFDLRHNYPNKSIRYAVNTICIMCESGFIPVFMRCPGDLKMLWWHFSGSFVHTCRGKCDGRFEMAAAAVAFASAESTNTDHDPAGVRYKSGQARTRSTVLSPPERKKKKKWQESLTLCRLD